jgi:Tol biopolymer transport system component
LEASTVRIIVAMRIPALLALVLLPAAATAQHDIVTPSLEWRRVETKYFTVLYPQRAEAWTLDMASRIDGAYAAVSALVGSAPRERVTVIVEDPSNAANGFAIPFVHAPVVFFWPTPPDPASGIGDSRSWGEMLSVHEYAHIAHLTVASRGREGHFPSLGWALDLGPVAEKSPRWVIEGYATFAEGRVTGRGRPHSVWRAAILREWALNGQLPTYAQLNGDDRFLGDNMAYLMGSAYLEWLVARPGQSDSSLAYVWRRMTARTNRSFDEAFAGVFGAPPAELYGRFTAELTVRAMTAESLYAADSASLGSAAPQTVQRLSWSTGAPAVSPNDSFVALTRGSPTDPTKVVIWALHPAVDTGAAPRAERARKLDSLDVPGIPWRPAPLEAVHTRYPQGGAPFFVPRWMPDGKRLLVTRATGPGDGVSRSDLFLWEPASNSVERITHAGGILHADATPDGKAAIADRCVDGICSLVRVDLTTGALTTIAEGAPRITYARPRVSPDGRTIAAARQQQASWRVVLIDIGGGTPREIGPADGAARYDPAWTADGQHVLVVSEAGGVPNIEEIDIATNAARQLTRVASAARAPEPSRRDNTIYFTLLRPRGYDLERIDGRAVPAMPPASAVESDASLAPAVLEAPMARDTFPVITLAPKPYGLGPRSQRVLPSFVYAAEGSSAGVMVSGLDPVGKLTWIAQGMYGTPGAWRGGSAAAAWRGWPVEVVGELFAFHDAPALQWGFAAPAGLDASSAGGLLEGDWSRDHITNTQRLAVGGTLAGFNGDGASGADRDFGFASYRGEFAHNFAERTVRTVVSVSGAAGRTAGEDWTRWTAGLTLSGGTDLLGVELNGQYGELDNANATFEQFSLGGTAPPFIEQPLYAQRIAMPALPAGVQMGTRMATVSAALPLMGLRPYFWAGAAGSALGAWEQVVGIEAGYSTDGIWFARLPGVRVSGGIGYAFRGTWKDETRVYMALTYHP